MSLRGPRLEFAVGSFLLLALATLLVLALASTNGQLGLSKASYPLKARFTSIGQLRVNGPVKIGGVTIGRITDIELDPERFDAQVTLAIDSKFNALPADTMAGVFTSGLLGEAYIGLQPGGDMEMLKAGDEIAFTQPAVDLLQLAGKYMFGGSGGSESNKGSDMPDSGSAQEDAPQQP